MDNLMKLFSSIKFPLVHYVRGTLGFFQFGQVRGDSNAHSKHSKIFYLVVFFFVFLPFLHEISFAASVDVLHKFSPSQVMLAELGHDKDIQGSFSRFELSEIGSKKCGKGGVCLDVLVSSGSPEGKTMMDEKSRQSEYSAPEENKDWSVYIGLLPMIITSFYLWFSPTDEDRRKKLN